VAGAIPEREKPPTRQEPAGYLVAGFGFKEGFEDLVTPEQLFPALG